MTELFRLVKYSDLPDMEKSKSLLIILFLGRLLWLCDVLYIYIYIYIYMICSSSRAWKSLYRICGGGADSKGAPRCMMLVVSDCVKVIGSGVEPLFSI